MRPIDETASKLEMRDIYISKCSYERHADVSDGKLLLEVKKAIEFNQEKSEHTVALNVSVTNESAEFIVNVECVGVFYISETDPMSNTLINRNTVAILFPYVRSQITLLTSAPGVQPIVLPAINIIQLLEG